jgi:hypothetical protein
MKKYIISVLIPYLLLQFSGCFNMQTITKDEFLQDSDYFELNVKTIDKELSFEAGNYSVINDTIYGKGEVKSLADLKNTYKPFDGGIPRSEVEKMNAHNFGITIINQGFIVKTKKRKFIFEEGNYSFKIDSIYGNGKSIARVYNESSFEPFEGGISINDIEEIQTDNYDFISTNFDLIVVLKENEIVFEANNYIVSDDSIAGKGKIISKIKPKQLFEPFEGALSVNDLEEIQVYKFNLTTVIALVVFIALTAVLVISVYGSSEISLSY